MFFASVGNIDVVFIVKSAFALTEFGTGGSACPRVTDGYTNQVVEPRSPT